jgi:hypothetical protein
MKDCLISVSPVADWAIQKFTALSEKKKKKKPRCYTTLWTQDESQTSIFSQNRKYSPFP